MVREKPRLPLLVQRITEARQIVADQHKLIAELKAATQSTLDAEVALELYRSSLKHLEGHELRRRRIDTEVRREQRCRNCTRAIGAFDAAA